MKTSLTTALLFLIACVGTVVRAEDVGLEFSDAPSDVPSFAPTTADGDRGTVGEGSVASGRQCFMPLVAAAAAGALFLQS